jgi:hypothetical protein
MSDDSDRRVTPATRGARNVRTAIVDISEPSEDGEAERDSVLGRRATQWAHGLLETARFEMARADDKANTLFRFYGVVAALAIGVLAGNSWSPNQLTTASQALFWAGCTSFTISGVCLGLILYPRRVRVKDRDRLLFFGHVNAYANRAELTKALQATEHDTEDRTLDQLIVISRLVENKFAYMRTALIMLAVGTALIGGALVANAVG